MARTKTMPRHTAAPEQSDRPATQTQATQTPAEPDGSTKRRRGSRGATTNKRGGRRAADHENHSMFEERSVLDALWSAVVAAPTSVIPPASPDADEAQDGPAPHGAAPDPAPGTQNAAPTAPAAPPAAPSRTPEPEPFVPVLGRPILPTTPLRTAPPPTPEHTEHVPPEHPAPLHPAPEHPAPEHASTGNPTAGYAAPRHPAAPPPRATGPFDLSYAAAPSSNRTIWAGPRHAAPPDWGSTSALLTIETPAAVTDAGLLVLRLVVGLTMAAHGAQKAFGMFGGAGLSTTADGFSALGYQPGILFALAAVAGELFGGLFLAAGLLTPLAAGGIIGVTVNAMVAVNLGNGFFASHDGIELPLILSGAALGLLLAGPGRYAVDARIPFFNGAAVQCVAAGIALLAMLASLGARLL